MTIASTDTDCLDTNEGSYAADCDDADSAESPGKTEGTRTTGTCLDSKDNDCDGKIDGADPGCCLGC